MYGKLLNMKIFCKKVKVLLHAEPVGFWRDSFRKKEGFFAFIIHPSSCHLHNWYDQGWNPALWGLHNRRATSVLVIECSWAPPSASVKENTEQLSHPWPSMIYQNRLLVFYSGVLLWKVFPNKFTRLKPLPEHFSGAQAVAAGFSRASVISEMLALLRHSFGVRMEPVVIFLTIATASCKGTLCTQGQWSNE